MFQPPNTFSSISQQLADGLEAGTIALRPSSSPETSRPRTGVPVSIALGTVFGFLIFFAFHVSLPGFAHETPLAEKHRIAAHLAQWLNLPTFVFFFVAIAELVRSAIVFQRESRRTENDRPEVAYEQLRSLSQGGKAVIRFAVILLPTAGVLATLLGLLFALQIPAASEPIAFDAQEWTRSIGPAFNPALVALLATFAVAVIATLMTSLQRSKLLDMADRLTRIERRF